MYHFVAKKKAYKEAWRFASASAPCGSYYHHPDKTVGNCKTNWLRKRLHRWHVTHPPCLSREMPNVCSCRQLSGYMTNNLFASLHAHSKCLLSLPFSSARQKRCAIIAWPSARGCSLAIWILATATNQGRHLVYSALLEVWLLFEGGN